MKITKILLISNKVYHYRIPIYNYFHDAFAEQGIEFSVLTNEIQPDNPNPLHFHCEVRAFSIKAYQRYIKKYKPDVAIFFLHLKDWVVWPLIPYLYAKRIPYIYWGHGINLQDPDNHIKNWFFNLLHKYSSAIVLYSPAQEKDIREKYRHKIFIAPNTLNFYAFPELHASKDALKKELNIPYQKVVLFVGRVQERKRLDILLEIFSKKQTTEYGLVIAGPDIQPEQLKIIEDSPAITYLGALYEEKQINSVFKLSDVFSIPGTIGLGLNQAFYWGLPVVTMDVLHSPEIYYLKDGYNGFVVEPTAEAVEEKLHYLLTNEKLLRQFSENARKTAREESGIENMLQGFYQAIDYVAHHKKDSAG